MDVEQLPIKGAFKVCPLIHEDRRGRFLESFRLRDVEATVNRRFHVRQANTSQSKQGIIRGVHSAHLPPGQAKFVSCVQGEIVDVVLDLRLGSPTFGHSVSLILNDQTCESVFIPEGLGHAFMVVSESATVHYLCSEPYNPKREFGILPTDPELEIAWPPDIEVILSDKDAAAPSLAEAASQGLLPTYAECEEWYASLRVR